MELFLQPPPPPIFPFGVQKDNFLFTLPLNVYVFREYREVFLNRRVAARYRALASIIPGRERPEETTTCYKI